MLFFPIFFALTGGLRLQWLLGYNFSVAVAVGYTALFVSPVSARRHRGGDDRGRSPETADRS